MLVSILVVLLILGLLLYAVQIAPLDGRISRLVQIVLIVIAAVYLLRLVGAA